MVGLLGDRLLCFFLDVAGRFGVGGWESSVDLVKIFLVFV